MRSKPVADKRTLRETRALLSELDEAKFLVQNLDDTSDEDVLIQAGSSKDIETAVSNLQSSRSQINLLAPGVYATKPSERLKQVFDGSDNEKNVAEKLLALPRGLKDKLPGFGDAGKVALAVVTSALTEEPESKSRFLRRFPDSGLWDDLQLQLFSLGSGGATETTGKGEIALFCTYKNVNKSKGGKAYDLSIDGKNASVKYFAKSPTGGPRTASGSGEDSEKKRFLEKVKLEIPDFQKEFAVANLNPKQVAELYQKILDRYPDKFVIAEDVAKKVSLLLYQTLTNNDSFPLIGCSDTGFKVLTAEEICFVNISDSRYRIAVAPNITIGSTTYKSRWVPESSEDKAVADGKTKQDAKNALNKTFAGVTTVPQVQKLITAEVAKLLNLANFATKGDYNVTEWDKMASDKLTSTPISAQSIVKALTTDIVKPQKTKKVETAETFAPESVLRDSRSLLRELFS